MYFDALCNRFASSRFFASHAKGSEIQDPSPGRRLLLFLLRARGFFQLRDLGLECHNFLLQGLGFLVGRIDFQRCRSKFMLNRRQGLRGFVLGGNHLFPVHDL